MVRISQLTLPMVSVLVAVCAAASAQPNTGQRPSKSKLSFDERYFQETATALNSRDPVVLKAAIARVGSIAGLDPDFAERYKPRLKQLLNSEDRRVREFAAKALSAYTLQDGASDERETINALRGMGARITFNSSRKVGFVDLPHAFSDSDVPLLLKLKELEDLGMGKSEVTDAGVAQLTKLPMLRSIILPPKATNAALPHLAELNNLEELGLVSSTQITDDGLLQLKDLKQLQSIFLPAFGRIGDKGLAGLRDLHQLRHIAYPNNLSNATLAYLAELPKLESLQIAYCKNITDEGLIHVEKMRNLRTVRLPPATTDAGLSHVCTCKHITWLDLRYCAITDEGVKHIQKLTALKALSLPSGVTDQAIECLRHLPNLHSLGFHGAPITDTGLLQLADFQKLRRVAIINGSVSEAGIATLQNERADLRIEAVKR